MPMVRVSTNLPDKDVPPNFEERLTDLLAESMNKPRNRIAIEVYAGQRITHGASRNPVVLVKTRDLAADRCLLDSRSVSRQTVWRQCMSRGGICLQQGRASGKQKISPLDNVEVESIGALSPEDNIRHTTRMTQFFQEVLRLPKDKVVISYFDLSPNNVGFAGTTVAAATV